MHGAITLRTCYAVSGTDRRYRATRKIRRCPRTCCPRKPRSASIYAFMVTVLSFMAILRPFMMSTSIYGDAAQLRAPPPLT
eukprot:808827-Rhodomonas_salina.1